MAICSAVKDLLLYILTSSIVPLKYLDGTSTPSTPISTEPAE